MKRYEKIVFETEDRNIIFKDSEEPLREKIIEVPNILKVHVYSENYANPPIPKGYRHICGEWNNGFVIERCSDGSQFVWIPVGSLDYAIRMEVINPRCDINKMKSKEPTYEVFQNYPSVIKYGGFYISRYNISRNETTGKPQSKKYCRPWTGIDFRDIARIAEEMEPRDDIISGLPSCTLYETILEWFIESNARTYNEIAKDSSNWGNCKSGKIKVTGYDEEWTANNIYDFAGNVYEWTCSYIYHIKRTAVRSKKIANEYSLCGMFQYFNDIGFRVVLFIQ